MRFALSAKDAFKKVKGLSKKDIHVLELLKKGGVVFFINCLGLALGYVFIVLLSKVYGKNSASIYGAYVLITLILRVGSIVNRLGTDTAMLQLTASLGAKNLWHNVKSTNRKFLKITVGLGLCILAVYLLGHKIVETSLKLNGSAVVITGFFILPMALGLYYSQALRGLKVFGVSSFLQNSSLPIFNFLFFVCAYFLIKPASAYFETLPSFTYLLSIVVTLIIGFVCWAYYINRKGSGASFDSSLDKSIKGLIKFSYPFLLVESMIFITTWVDQVMLGVLGSNKDVGIFNVCVKYTMISSLFLQSINTISAPKFAEFFAKSEFDGLRKYFKNTSKLIFWSSVPVILAFIIFPTFFLNLFGNVYTEGKYAMIIINIGSFVNIMTGSVGTLLQMTGHQKTIQYIISSSAVIQVILNIILIPRMGITGAAIACSFGVVFNNILMAVYVRKYFKFSCIYVPFIGQLNK